MKYHEAVRVGEGLPCLEHRAGGAIHERERLVGVIEPARHDRHVREEPRRDKGCPANRLTRPMNQISLASLTECLPEPTAAPSSLRFPGP